MREPPGEQLTIDTPEGVAFALPLAGIASRGLAWMLDIAVILAGYVAVSAVLALAGVVSTGIYQAASTVALFVALFGYHLTLEWLMQGRTVGKWALGLRVVDGEGLRLSFPQIALRNILRVIDALPLAYLVGSIAALASPYRQRLGDLAANTVVIRTRASAAPDFSQLAPARYNSFRDYPHLEARLRQVLSPEDAALGVEALLRRDTIAPEARLLVFAELAAYYRERVRFPDEVAQDLSDEQYVRNVIDSVFRDARRRADLSKKKKRNAKEQTA